MSRRTLIKEKSDIKMEINNIVTCYYDVIVVGAGPAGLFAAYKLCEKKGHDFSILVIDKGESPDNRTCEALNGICGKCENCNLVSGGGGSGLFSDGKLIMDVHSGGHLKEIFKTNKKEALEREVETVINKFALNYIHKKSLQNSGMLKCIHDATLNFKPFIVTHLGSANLKKFVLSLISHLKSQGASFKFNTKVLDIEFEPIGERWIIETDRNKSIKKFSSKYLLISVGKEGNLWLSNLIAEKFKGFVDDNNTFIGLRMEIDDRTAKNFYNISLDPKICKFFGETKVKTHCFCRHGQILILKYFGLPLAGGHSPNIEIDEKYNPTRYANSNLAFIYRDNKVCTYKNAIKIMQKVDEITNGKLIVQRLGDYLNDVHTTNEKLSKNHIRPSNLNIAPGRIDEEILPGFRDYFISFLELLSFCAPGIMDQDNLLYAPTIEWWMRKIHVNANMMVEIGEPNLYVIGDGSGWTQGIVQSAATGIVAADDILRGLFPNSKN